MRSPAVPGRNPMAAAEGAAAAAGGGPNAATSGTLVAPTTLPASGLEYSVHRVPRAQRDEVAALFPAQCGGGLAATAGPAARAFLDELLLVPTTQRAAADLAGVGAAVEREKDTRLEAFLRWAEAVCAHLAGAEAGPQGEGPAYFCDYADPCSGLPMRHRATQKVYDEVSALAVLRHYRCANAGCCKVVLHPRWGSAVYPATLFARAPLPALQAAVAAAERAFAAETSAAAAPSVTPGP